MRDIDFQDDLGDYFYAPSYSSLIDSFEVTTLIEEHDNDYQGDSYLLLSNGSEFGLLIFGWGSCSGCDALEACSSPVEVTELRDELWNSITWRTESQMIEYLSAKDWSLEYYYGSGYFHSSGGGFVHNVLTWFDLPHPPAENDEY